MPIASYKQYCEMLDRAKKGKFAYPAINITGLETLNACLEGFSKAGCDGIIQVSTGGGAHATGMAKDMALGAIVIAEAAHRLAEKCDVMIALHTDHCHPKNIAPFLDPLIEESERRVAAGQTPLFNSHMLDGSELSMEENIALSKKYLTRLAKINIILEIETGVVGGEEDGHDTSGQPIDKLYTSPEDMVMAYEELNGIGRFLLAATFGNVHGVYKPGNVKLTPKILKDGQAAVATKHKTGANPMDLVFHGGSGSSQDEIHETLGYGVVKMNVDTDTQYAFTRPLVDHIFKNYDGVLKIEGEVGNKKVYDPRAYLKNCTTGLAERIYQACVDLRELNTSMFKK